MMEVNVRVTVDNAVLERLDKLIDVLNKCCAVKMPTDMLESTAKTENTAVAETMWETVEPKPTEADDKLDAKTEDIPTRDDVVMALQALAKKKADKTASKSLLEKFGATKVSDLKSDDYSAIIKAAEEMM